jgi:hypothetical protein
MIEDIGYSINKIINKKEELKSELAFDVIHIMKCTSKIR